MIRDILDGELEGTPMTKVKVVVQPDHFEKLLKRSPISAVEELIWNAFDGDATQVDVHLDENQIGPLRIQDFVQFYQDPGAYLIWGLILAHNAEIEVDLDDESIEKWFQQMLVLA